MQNINIMKVYESGIVYKKTYEGMTEEGFRATFVITYITLEIKQGLFGIKRKFKINQRSEGLSNYSEALKLNKAYDKKKEEFDEIMSLTNPTVKEK